jgi:RNA polymerase sigma-70 factor (ECF subfamily)
MAAHDTLPLRLIRGSGGDATREPHPDSRLEDQALVAAVQSGDPKIAFQFCARLSPQVNRTVRRLLGRIDSDHDDIVQISLIEIVQTIGRYRGDCSLDRWAQTVTAHAVFKHIRRRKLERQIFTSVLSDQAQPGPFSLDQQAIARGLLARVAGHLDELNESRAWAFLLHDGLGFDLGEIAEMTGTSVAAAQSRLSRGRRELHERIARDPELADLLRAQLETP